MNLNLTATISLDLLAEQLSQIGHDEFIALVMETLDHIAEAEVDERLIARLYRGLDGCYDPLNPRPTIEEMLDQYPDVKEEGADQ